MFRRSESNLLRKRDPQYHSRLAVVGKPLAGCAVDERVEVGYPSHHLAGDGHGQSEICGREALCGLRRGVESPAATKDQIEHLQSGTPSRNALNAWHGAV